MSEETRDSRAAIYEFLRVSGIDIEPIRKRLKKLLVDYSKTEAIDLMGEIAVLRDRIRRHRAVITSLHADIEKLKK